MLSQSYNSAQDLASENITRYDIFTPLSAFPMLLHEEMRAYGLAWYVTMLNAAKMQGPLGSSPAGDDTGEFSLWLLDSTFSCRDRGFAFPHLAIKNTAGTRI
jgi:hypothetical protein